MKTWVEKKEKEGGREREKGDGQTRGVDVKILYFNLIMSHSTSFDSLPTEKNFFFFFQKGGVQKQKRMSKKGGEDEFG